MPLGLVDDSQFELEKDRLDSVPIISRVVDKTPAGRKDGDNNVPESLRKIIGETSELDGRQSALALASMFGVSPSSTSAYGNGATSTASYNKPSAPIKSHIQKSKDRIAVKARGVLRVALDQITEEKLSVAKVVDIATVAKSMSSVMKDMEPDTRDNDVPVNRPQIVIFAPMIRRESEYEVIDAHE